MNKFFSHIAMLCAALFFTACSDAAGDIDDHKSQIELSDDVQKLFDEGLEITAAGGAQSVTFYASAPWSFGAKAAKSEATEWWHVDPSSGEAGENTCRIEYDPNTSSEDRDITLQLKVGTESLDLAIDQAASDTFFITGDSFIVAAEGETVKVITTSNIEYKISIDESTKWITAITAKSSAVAAEHLFAVAKNETGGKRVGYIDFTAEGATEPERVTITQQQNNIYILSEASYQSPAEGEIIEVSVTANIGYQVAIPTQYDWIKQIQGKAVVTDKLQFEIAENRNTELREGYIEFTFEGATEPEKVVIKQAAAIPASRLAITPTTYEAKNSAGDEFSFAVDANVEYQLAIPAECASWLVRVDDGSDPTTLTFRTLSDNINTPRKVTISLTATQIAEPVQATITQAMSNGLRRLYLFEPFDTAAGYPVLDIDPVLIENSAVRVNVVDDYGAKADGVSNDNAAVQEAINFVASQENGGIVYLPQGVYMLDGLKLASNVHIHIEAGSTLRLPTDDYSNNKTLFDIGSDGLINNVLISGVKDGRFDIATNERYNINIEDAPAGKSPRLFRSRDVHNFYYGDVNIYDRLIEISHFTFGANIYKDPDIFGPTDGVVRNISSFNCHYGYGTVQAQCAKRLLFSNLYGVGGAVLRFETGLDAMNLSQFGGLFDIRGVNISGKNGNSAVMISPHSMHNGVVQVSEIKGESMGIVARLDEGYAMKDSDGNVLMPAGTYADGGYIANVDCTFGMNAQVKSKHFQYMPESLLQYLPDEPYYKTIYVPAPSVCPVLNTLQFPVLGTLNTSGYLPEVNGVVTQPATRE